MFARRQDRSPGQRAVGLLVVLLLGACSSDPPVVDAALDGSVDAGAPQRDARPPTPPTPVPPRPRPLDAGCPPPPDPGAAWVLDLGLTTFDVGDLVRSGDGGAWVVATSSAPTRLWWMRFDVDGAPRVVRRAAIDVAEPPRAAPVPGGGVVLTSRLADALLVVRIDADGEVEWAHTRTPLDARFRGPTAIAADTDGIAVAGSLSLATTRTEAVEFAWLTPTGETSHGRRISGARDFAALDAIALSTESAVLSIRTDGFSARTHVVSELAIPVVTPWIVAVDRDGGRAWDTSFDVSIGTHLHLDTLVRSASGWSLGGATEASTGRPWVVELTSEGVVRTVAELPRIPGLSVVDLARDEAGLRMMQSTSDLLYLGPANAEPEALVRLDMRRGSARLLPGRGLYAGPPPPCDARIASSSHPALCGTTRRSMMLLPLPGDSVSPCMRTLFVEPLDDQDRSRPLPVELETGPDLQPSDSAVESLTIEAEAIDVDAQRLCISRPGCIRAFPAL
ncbi:MAG: hypothetical protein AB8I08_24415 [Sandaracinaceae bacterium]